MLPAGARLRRRDEFVATLRQGVSSRARRSGRTSRALLVVHAATDPSYGDPVHAPARPRVGFVVSRQVGPAVVRNRVKRRLRHLMAARLDALPAGSRLVVRALPAAATATSPELAADLDRALERTVSR